MKESSSEESESDDSSSSESEQSEEHKTTKLGQPKLNIVTTNATGRNIYNIKSDEAFNPVASTKTPYWSNKTDNFAEIFRDAKLEHDK